MAVPAYPLAHGDDRGDWPAPGEWTYEDYLRLPGDGNRYEVIRGVLYVTAAPRWEHQDVGSELELRLRPFVRQRRLGVLVRAPFDVRLPRGISDPVQPDLVFFRKGNTPLRGSHSFEGVPDLVVEILSPGTWQRDHKVKLPAYEEAGVPECWLVDPGAHAVVVYVLENGRYVELVRGGVGDSVWSSVLPGFRVQVADLFLTEE